MSTSFLSRWALPLVLMLALSAAGCQRAYYRTMEAFGKEKRDLLIDNVEEARDSQNEAKEQFSSALEEFSALMNFDGGELEEIYDRLEREYDRSESRAEAVREHIGDVDRVAQDLFAEWEEELELYSNDRLRQNSAEQLRETRAQYEELIAAMRRAESRMDPVLATFQDQVLYLKHNLNARAIASLEEDLVTLQADIQQLITEMEDSINEANAFIERMQA
jgi:hypothetical protein